MFYLPVPGTLGSCKDKNVVLESLNLLFTNEVGFYFSCIMTVKAQSNELVLTCWLLLDAVGSHLPLLLAGSQSRCILCTSGSWCGDTWNSLAVVEGEISFTMYWKEEVWWFVWFFQRTSWNCWTCFKYRFPVQILKETKYPPIWCLLLYQKFGIPAWQQGLGCCGPWKHHSGIFIRNFTVPSPCSFVVATVLKSHQLPLHWYLKISVQIKSGNRPPPSLWVTTNYLKACCLHGTCSVGAE